MKATDAATLMAAQMSEKDFQTQVLADARSLRWRAYHTAISYGSAGGFPDLVLIRPPRLIFAELKRQSTKSQPTTDQQSWLDDLNAVGSAIHTEIVRRMTDDDLHTLARLPGVESYLWRPIDLYSKKILEVLR